MTEEEKLFLEAGKPMHDAYVNMLRGMYEGIDDWDYHCLPWIAEKYWNELVELIGQDNIKVCVNTISPDDRYGRLYHPTIFVSPAGKAKLKDYLNANSKDAAATGVENECVCEDCI